MLFCYMTASSKKEAEKIARTLLSKKLVACVNIIAGARSLYWWKGKIQKSNEVVLIAKTERRLMNSLVAAVKKTHSYEVPCVVALPIVKGNASYLAWLKESVSNSAKTGA